MSLTPRDGVAVVAVGMAAVALGVAAWFGVGSRDGVGRAADSIGLSSPRPSAAAASGEPAPTAGASGEMLVDVQGAVARPGLVRLPAGARVADAIAAAGGYADQADLLAAATGLNLAATLSDGAQVFVPIQGVAAAPAGGGSGGTGPAGGGLVNLNTASPEALEALPGIGPVTVQKIVAARQERPFATLDELVERDVMHRGQLDGIRELVTL